MNVPVINHQYQVRYAAIPRLLCLGYNQVSGLQCRLRSTSDQMMMTMIGNRAILYHVL